jgi:NRAMP (natural resistance-associated macrophage protein)-like metal ion transporter
VRQIRRRAVADPDPAMPNSKIEAESFANPKRNAREESFWKELGPGLITGAADDDPSGIATYSQIGAQFGMGMLWTMLFSVPLMVGIQEICARLGRITGAGVAAGLKKQYPKPVVYALVSLLCAANIFNLGADVAAMGAVTSLVVGGKSVVYAIALGALSLLLQVFIPYRRYVRYLKWLTLILFVYVGVLFVVRIPWLSVLKSTLVPSFEWNQSYWVAFVGVLGTTISPYLFFWQTSEEVEEIQTKAHDAPLQKKPEQAERQFRRINIDTLSGMVLSNVIAYAIILTTAVTIHASGQSTDIETATQAASALKPLVGEFAYLLFAIGILGTGLLAVPVLAGSAAYAVAETFRWRASLEVKPQRAPKFYMVIAIATVIGIALTLIGMNPIRALYWAAVFNGVAAGPLMFALMRMSENPKIVGQFRLPQHLRVLGWTATLTMIAASLALLAFSVSSSAL